MVSLTLKQFSLVFGDFIVKSLTPSVKVALKYMIQQNRIILF
jgi:hypothetical protein